MKPTGNTMMTKTIGFFTEPHGLPSTKEVTIRFTSDKVGEILSLAVAEGMITVSYEPVKELIQETRARKKAKK